jgi:hypothetical protein
VGISYPDFMQGDDPEEVEDFAAEFWEEVIHLVHDPEDSPPLSAQEMLGHIHGRTSKNEQAAMLQVLREGLPGDVVGLKDATLSFGALCLACGNGELLKQVADAGPPDGFHRKRTLTKSQWLDELCCVRNSTSCHPSTIYATILERLGPASAQMLRYALDVSPDHPCIAAPRVDQRLASRFPGNLHYALLHVALNGTVVPDDVLIRAKRVNQEPRSGVLDHFSKAAVECLKVVREHRIPVLPPAEQDYKGEMVQVGLDAMPFVTASGYGAEYEVALELLRTYWAYSGVSYDAKLRESHRDVGGCIPLDVAIWAGASGPAAALIELHCNLDPAVVCTVYGGDPVRAAQEGNRPETAAAVAEALMRRRIADSPSSPKSEPTAAARRRRVSI